MTTFRWLGNSDIIRQILTAWPGAPAPTWALGYPVGQVGTYVANYKSFAQFKSDQDMLRGGGRLANWVMYDPESWDWTPANEAADPWTYLPRFGQYAHAHGYRVITAPARDLGNVTDSIEPKQPGEDLNDWYILNGVAEAAAEHAEIVSVQSQALTEDVASYTAFVKAARRQARGANPYVQVLAGISTRYGTPAQMAAAARSVTVDGYWLNVPDGDIGKAVEFLKLMTGGTT